MGTLIGSKAKTGVQARAGVGAIAVHSEYSGSATLSSGDVIQMIKVPKGARVISAQLRSNSKIADQGSHLQVGDGVDTDRYISASGGTTVAGTAINQPVGETAYEYTAEDTIDIKVVVVGGTATARSFYALDVVYSLDDSTVL